MINPILFKKKTLSSENWLFVIAGQSNAKGYNTGAPLESYLNDPIPRVYTRFGTSWQILEYGVNNEGDNGHGIELNLGYLASQLTTGNIYIVKYAVNSSALGELAGSSNDWSTSDTLFTGLLNKFNASVANLVSNSIPYVFKGFWWDQGETDANDATLYADYETNLNALETRVRSQFTDGNNLQNFITVRLDSKITRTYLTEVRAAQMTKNYVNADDLSLQGDNIHHTSLAENILAQRFLNKCL